MSDFEILLSPKGPVLLEGEQRLKVIDAVLSGKTQFGDIVSETGYAKSSTSVVLKKLAEEGLIRTEGEGNDKRFYPLAARMISSVEPDTAGLVNLMRGWASESQDIRLEQIEVVMAGYLIIEAHQHGLSIQPMIVEMARMLARLAYERNKDGDRSLDYVTDFLGRTDRVVVKKISEFPPTFDVITLPKVTEYTRISMAMAVSRFITDYTSLITGSSYHLSRYELLGDDTIRIELGYSDVRPEFASGLYHDIKFDASSSSEFAIYHADGRYVPVSDPLELRILNCVEKRRYSSRDLMGELEEPQTTILGHLKSMEESKLLLSQKSGNRSIYFLSAEKLFSWKRPEMITRPCAVRYLEYVLDNPEHIIQLMLSFLIVDAKELGFDISPLLSYVGGRIADMICSIAPSITAEQLFAVIQRESKRFTGSEIVLKSYNPPTVFRLSDYDIDPVIADSQRIFYNALFARIFGILMHIEFVVKTDKVFGDGLRKYEASFMPKMY